MMTTLDSHSIAGDRLVATVNARGAELTSLVDADAGEVLWQAGPVWPNHAPNLFPIVGQLTGDRLNVDGKSYPLKRHGFARNRAFTWLERGGDRCALVLRDDDETRAVYPFAFEFEIGYAIAAATLTVTYVVRNPGGATLPASVGAHPAFRWPLVDGVPKEAYTIAFAQSESAPVRRLDNGLLKTERFPTPVSGATLALADDLFSADALIFDQLASRSVRYAAPGSPAIAVAWTGFCELGIWSKPGAAFVCIEPWHGYASPVGFDGPFAQKPGILLVPPGESRTLTMAISVEPPAAG